MSVRRIKKRTKDTREALIDHAIQMYDVGNKEKALALLTENRIDVKIVHRVLLLPKHRRKTERVVESEEGATTLPS